MKITDDWLIERGACGDGIRWFKNQGCSDSRKLIKKLAREGSYYGEWTSWLASRTRYVGIIMYEYDIWKKVHVYLFGKQIYHSVELKNRRMCYNP